MVTDATAVKQSPKPTPPAATAFVAPGNEHYNVLRLPGHYIDMVLRYEYGERLALVRYELEVSGITIKGQTDEKGRFQAKVPAKKVEGKLTIWLVENDPEACLTLPILINGLPPVTETGGVQARLNNLGLNAGPVTGEMNETTKAAIIEFQELLEYEKPTGQLDRETLDMLEAMNNAL
jgi:hypothetical protein